MLYNICYDGGLWFVKCSKMYKWALRKMKHLWFCIMRCVYLIWISDWFNNIMRHHWNRRNWFSHEHKLELSYRLRIELECIVLTYNNIFFKSLPACKSIIKKLNLFRSSFWTFFSRYRHHLRKWFDVWWLVRVVK